MKKKKAIKTNVRTQKYKVFVNNPSGQVAKKYKNLKETKQKYKKSCFKYLIYTMYACGNLVSEIYQLFPIL